MPSIGTLWTAIVGDLILALAFVLFCAGNADPPPDVLLDQRDAVAEWNQYNPPAAGIDVDISQQDRVIHARYPAAR